MIFTVENKAEVSNPKNGQLSKALKSLKSYRSPSYASLTNEDGSYLQVAGGGITCMVEYFDGKDRFRAFHKKPNPNYPDGTVLRFSAGQIAMQSDEWFRSDQVIEIFCAFNLGEKIPDYVFWRKAPGF